MIDRRKKNKKDIGFQCVWSMNYIIKKSNVIKHQYNKKKERIRNRNFTFETTNINIKSCRVNKTEKIDSERNFLEAPLQDSNLTIKGEAVGTTKPMTTQDFIEKNPNTSLGGMAEQTKKIALFDKVLN